MSLGPPERSAGIAEPSREKFADGSALVTYADGSVLIAERAFARVAVFHESRLVNYNYLRPTERGQA